MRFEAFQISDRNLEPDHEQQQHHTDLGEELDLMGVVHQPQRLGASENPSEQQADRRGQPQPMAHHHRQHRQPEDRDQVEQQALHGDSPQGAGEKGPMATVN